MDLYYSIQMRDIETKLLRSFLSVATQQSFSAAAEFMDCSQGTMSLRIRSLERQTGVLLFNRKGQKVELTGAGRDLLPAVQDFVDMHDRLKDRINSGLVSGTVRLGVAECLGVPLLARLLRTDPHLRGDLELSVRCQLSRQLQQKVQARSLDLAVVINHEQHSKATQLARPQMHWVAAPGFISDRTSPLPLASFPAGCSLRDVGIEALDQAGIAYRFAVCSPSGQVVQGAVESGAAVTILPDGIIPPDWKIVGPALGLPNLGFICIELVERLGRQSEAVAAVKRAIGSVFNTMYRPVENQHLLDVSVPMM